MNKPLDFLKSKKPKLVIAYVIHLAYFLITLFLTVILINKFGISRNVVTVFGVLFLTSNIISYKIKENVLKKFKPLKENDIHFNNYVGDEVDALKYLQDLWHEACESVGAKLDFVFYTDYESKKKVPFFIGFLHGSKTAIGVNADLLKLVFPSELTACFVHEIGHIILNLRIFRSLTLKLRLMQVFVEFLIFVILVNQNWILATLVYLMLRLISVFLMSISFQQEEFVVDEFVVYSKKGVSLSRFLDRKYIRDTGGYGHMHPSSVSRVKRIDNHPSLWQKK